MVGIDEVGRGSLAGPLLVMAARQTGDLPDDLTDSKLLSRQSRESIFDDLALACQFGEGWVKPTEIDKIGLAKALRLGVARALKSLGVESDEEIIMDGPVNYCPGTFTNIRCMINADANIPIVSAASVYAKVRRDRFMRELARHHPRYGFDSHVGYGTKAHMEALSQFGVIKGVHRQIYAPVRRFGGAEL